MIAVMHIYFLKEITQEHPQHQIILVKKAIFKNCAPFTNCISKINNIKIDNAEYINIVMPVYNLIEYSYNYSKTSGSLWHHCKEIPAINNDGNIVIFNGANATDSFNFKAKIAGRMET